jgi:hypothetical protein
MLANIEVIKIKMEAGGFEFLPSPPTVPYIIQTKPM